MKKQQGLTLISWVVVLVFLLFQIVIAMQVIPVYVTDSSVKTLMENMEKDPELQNLPPKKLKQTVIKRLSVNSVYAVQPEDIRVKKGRGENIVIIDYEPRGKLIGNLEFIVHFRHEVRIPRGG